jgi:hypothetical protein
MITRSLGTRDPNNEDVRSATQRWYDGEMAEGRDGITRRRFAGALAAIVSMTSPASAQTTFDDEGQRGRLPMRILCRFEEKAFRVGLLDNPSARDLATMLPLDLVIEDFSTNEKIAYLPRKLTEEGNGPISNEAAGDLCYYAPWGNLAFFHGGYRYSNGLIRVGRLDDGPQPLLTRGKFELRIEHLPPA